MSNSFTIENRAFFSKDCIKLFQKEYEKYVLEIMNNSRTVFPDKYDFVAEQSHGECDFISTETREKFDAKLPFTKEQVKMLTDGKKHKPDIEKWIQTLLKEASDFNLNAICSGTYDISKTKLYTIMREQIDNDKEDENIIFFIPFPIVLSARNSVFLQFATDYLKAIYDKLKEELALNERKVYAIYPSAEGDCYAVRNLSKYYTEYITCAKIGKYLKYEMIG